MPLTSLFDFSGSVSGAMDPIHGDREQEAVTDNMESILRHI